MQKQRSSATMFAELDKHHYVKIFLDIKSFWNATFLDLQACHFNSEKCFISNVKENL